MREIPRATRIKLVHASVASRLFYSVGTWPVLPPLRVRRLFSAYMRPLRCVAGGRRTEDAHGQPAWNPDLHVCTELQVAPLRAHLAAATLRHA